MAVASTQSDWGALVQASKTSDKFTGWKSDPKTGQLVKVSRMDSENTAGELQDRFIKLLVAQLKNQDPNNPLDNAQVTSQMAQLSTVTGIQSLNDSFRSMSAMMTASQTMQATPMLGREVMFSGNTVEAQAGAPSKLAFNLDRSADRVLIEIKSQSGEVMDSMQLGRTPAGVQTMEWDGMGSNGQRVADGVYTFTVTASSGGQVVGSLPYSVARINSVSQDADGAVLQTSLSQGVKFADVKRVF